MPTQDFAQPWSIDDVTMAFPAHALKCMPAMEDIPEEFKKDEGWAATLWRDAMFHGLDDIQLIPNEGVDPAMAWRHLLSIHGSYEPKHEHKEAALAYLTTLWFEAARWLCKGTWHQPNSEDVWQ